MNYFLWCFSDFMQHPKVKYQLGYLYSFILLFSLVANIVALLVSVWGPKLKRFCKKRKEKRARQKLSDANNVTKLELFEKHQSVDYSPAKKKLIQSKNSMGKSRSPSYKRKIKKVQTS